MMPQVLELLSTPKTPEALARGLGLGLEAILLLLQQLERKGYVMPLSCKASCGLCSFRNVCPGPEATYWVRRNPPLSLGARLEVKEKTRETQGPKDKDPSGAH